MAFRVHQAPPLGTLMSQVDLNSDLINDSIRIYELRQFFTPEQLAKFDQLKALNVTLVCSDYQYQQNGFHNWTMNDADTGKLAGWCNSNLLLFAELSGVNIVFDYTMSGVYPQYFELWEDPKATIGGFWLQNDYRDTQGTFHSGREAGWENMKLRCLAADEAGINAALIPVDETSNMVLDQALNLHAAGYIIVLPPPYEFGAFGSIDAYVDANPGSINIRRVTITEWADFGFTLNPGEYYTYPSPPDTAGSVELSAPHSVLPVRIGIYVKNGVANEALINEVFEIISESGLPNSLGYNTMFEGAINENYQIVNTGDQYKAVALPAQLPLPVNSSTVSRDPRQQGDYRKPIPFAYDGLQRTIGAYSRSRSIIENGVDQSGTRISGYLSLAKYPVSDVNSFVVTDSEGLHRLANNMKSSPFNVTRADAAGI